MKIPSPRSKKRARVEIIPLIDIMFFLLATFMMVSLSMIKNKGIAVNLPVADTGNAEERTDSAVVTVAKDGGMFFNKVRCTESELVQNLQAMRSQTADPRVFINGDAEADFGQIVKVLDEARKIGILKVAIETVANNNNQAPEENSLIGERNL